MDPINIREFHYPADYSHVINIWERIEKGVRVGVSDAPKEIERATSDLRLDCVWSFGGCRRWNQLLPAVQPLLR